MTWQGGHDEPERGEPRACTHRRPPSRAPHLHTTQPYSACPLSAFNACVSRRKAQACLQADRRAKATGAEQHGQQARLARPCGPPARALAPSTPTRTPIRTPTSHRACSRRRSSPSPLFLIFLLSLLWPLWLYLVSGSSSSSSSSALCAFSWVGVGVHGFWACGSGRSALGALLLVLRSRCSALSLVAPLAAYVQIPIARVHVKPLCRMLSACYLRAICG